LVAHEIVAPEVVMLDAATLEMTGGVMSLDTVTEIVVAVVWLPAASRATAVMEWVPFEYERVFHEIAYGDRVSSAP